MLRRLLVVFFALVGAGVAFGQGARWFPEACAMEVVLTGTFVRPSDGKELPGATNALLGGYPESGWSWECTQGAYEIDLRHVAFAVGHMSAYGDGRLSGTYGSNDYGETWVSEENTDTEWRNNFPPTQVTTIGAQPGPSSCGYVDGNPANPPKVVYRALLQSYNLCAETIAQFLEMVVLPVRLLPDALDNAGVWVSESSLRQKLATAGGNEYEDDPWACIYEDPDLCFDGGGGDEPGGDGGGPTEIDWGDDYSSRCARENQEHGLNIFQFALSWAFEPCSDWGVTFSNLVSAGSDKAPFGFASWLQEFGIDPEDAVAEPSFLWPCAGAVSTNSVGGLFCSQPVEILGHAITPIDVRENVVVAWWHETGRAWLFYVLAGSIVWMMWRGLMGSGS